MDDNYIINLHNSPLSEEDFEREGKNLISIKIFNKEGNVINKNIYCIQIEFSKDGALGFGKELIRAVFNKRFDKEYHNHLTPIQNGKATQNMGVSITHNSPELVVVFKELDSIVNEIEKSKTE